jgi:hypothetical protein
MTGKIPWSRLVVAAVPAVIGAIALIWQANIIIDAKHDQERLEATIETLRAELASSASSGAEEPSSDRCKAEMAELRDHLSRAEAELVSLRAQSPVNNNGERAPNVTDVHGGSLSYKPFETESYRLTVGDVKKSGNTVRVTMVLEVLGENGFTFHAGKWYLLDENGERWNELNSDSPSARLESERALAAGTRAPFRDRVRLVPGTRVKDSLVFSATGLGEGVNFTLIGVEVEPQRRREIILRSLVASGG